MPPHPLKGESSLDLQKGEARSSQSSHVVEINFRTHLVSFTGYGSGPRAQGVQIVICSMNARFPNHWVATARDFGPVRIKYGTCVSARAQEPLKSACKQPRLDVESLLDSR